MISLPNERPAVSVFGLYHLLRKTSELFRGLILNFVHKQKTARGEQIVYSCFKLLFFTEYSCLLQMKTILLEPNS